MQSLRDKLLKAGLVTEDAAKKVETEKTAPPARPPAAPARQDSAPRPAFPRNEAPRREAPRREEVRVPKLPPLQGSKEAHRLAARKQVELDRKLRELVLANTVAIDYGATPFYFVTRKNKLRRLELTEQQAKRLELGELAVVERPDPDKIEHALVPPAIAQEMLKLSERAVRFLNQEGAKVGFLTDAEIHDRASEANQSDSVETQEAAPKEEGAPQAQTFITIKRAPLTS